MKRLFLKFILFLLSLLVIVSSFSNSIFSSSIVPRNIFHDINEDWEIVSNVNRLLYDEQYVSFGDCTKYSKKYDQNNLNDFPDISAVSFSSNGRQLTASLWLDSEINSSSQNILKFSIIISTSEPTEYGYSSARYDYEYSNIFDFTKGINFQELYEISPLSKYNKTILYQSSYTNITDINNKSAINISFDLSKIISPEKYRVYFTAEAYVLNENDTYCGIIDVTLPIPIPRPTFHINVIPSFISLREGETKDIQIAVNSSLPVESTVSLNTYKFKSSDDLAVNFSINTIHLEPYAYNIVVLHINALENPKSRLYSIPIYASWDWNMEHPTTNDPIKFNENVDIMVIVKIEEYPIQQQINDFTKGIHAIWKDNEGIIILLVGIFLTPFGAWIFDKIIKRKKERKNKK